MRTPSAIEQDGRCGADSESQHENRGGRPIHLLSFCPSHKPGCPIFPYSLIAEGWGKHACDRSLNQKQTSKQNPHVRFHFTPMYSSWLNQVELWFAKIEREVIARGVFTSVADLARKLRRYINAYSANSRPIQWKYSDPLRRIRTNEFTATGH
jgi:DDE superfamily endonuclease